MGNTYLYNFLIFLIVNDLWQRKYSNSEYVETTRLKYFVTKFILINIEYDDHLVVNMYLKHKLMQSSFTTKEDMKSRLQNACQLVDATVLFNVGHNIKKRRNSCL